MLAQSRLFRRTLPAALRVAACALLLASQARAQGGGGMDLGDLNMNNLGLGDMGNMGNMGNMGGGGGGGGGSGANGE